MMLTTVTVVCDRKVDRHCHSLDARKPVPTANRVLTARAVAKDLGWKRTSDDEHVCPECWSRRVRYYAGRPLVG